MVTQARFELATCPLGVQRSILLFIIISNLNAQFYICKRFVNKNITNKPNLCPSVLEHSPESLLS